MLLSRHCPQSSIAALTVLATICAGGCIVPGLAQSPPDTLPLSTVNTLPSLLPALIVPNRYTLGSGDRLRLEVFNVPEYSQEYQVLSDGTLSLPLLGTVEVAGMSLEEASANITQRYSRFFRRPTITLILLQARSVQIAIAGEVKRPGSYTVTPEGSQAERITVTKAIQLAGGITQSANIRDIQVVRSGYGATGSDQTIVINLWELLQDGNLSQDIVLQDGDKVIIPEALTLEAEDARALASASFAPSVMTVYVVGEVANPGIVEIPPNTPLNQAILAAGGFSNRANQNAVDLIRLNANGTVSQRNIDIDFSRNIEDSLNPALRNYDTVIVSRSGLSLVSDIVGTILSPVSGILRILDGF
ncbi:SLBB domain-containing protein [Nodosilinea sp. E11]|uniref:SLBB domain-containing protein n=1 Tax=Nodosilinea sp. E11 TaxID=3037479 RepID=UPI0029346796|nr:SLBB domain-containing protein [Nodosilinea sp. E11]WOD37409.1 SLBB domain-containing protein [Nodosilinea sp. E11]